MPALGLQETILALYRGSCNCPASAFKEWAMETVGAAIRFDSGIWVTSDIVSSFFNSSYLFRQPREMLENYFRTIRISGDLLAQAVISNVGRTINSDDIIPYKEFVRHPAYIKHCRHYGMEHSLSTAYVTPVVRIATSIAFYRDNPDNAFSEDDRQTKEILVPHMIEAMRINLFFHLRGAGEHGNRAMAICDREGRLYETTQQFVHALTQALPNWHGPNIELPSNISESLPFTNWVSNGLKFESTPCGDLLLLMVTKEDPIDRLTARQIEVAQMLVSGKKYKAIASDLAIAPSTVTKHVNEIHSRLKITNREELIRLFRRRYGVGGSSSLSQLQIE